MQFNEQLRSGTGWQTGQVDGHLVACRPEELRPHPSYDRHNVAPSASQLAAIAALGDFAFQEPISITRDRIIIDGHARWKLARMMKRPTLVCMEYQVNDVEALQMLLRTHRRLRGFTPFNRISLALDLKPFFQQKAKSNQRIGGHQGGLSNLTTGAAVHRRPVHKAWSYYLR
ncbi:MAG: ParB/RepB/Spo0J family partition protein [Candidatus Sulfotelmatobacter sp.]